MGCPGQNPDIAMRVEDARERALGSSGLRLLRAEASAAPDSRHKLRNAGLTFAANRETLAGFSPQTAKPDSLRRSTPETGVRYISTRL
jgi:hypothetical protein